MRSNLPTYLLRSVAVLFLGACLASTPLIQGCKTAPVTGRKQFAFLGQDQMMQLGDQAYKEALSKEKIDKDPAVNAMVQRVGNRIAQAAMEDSQDARNYKWEFTVIDDPQTVNAWCLPGGKVAVYTGILKVTGNEAGLATVLSHEIAHATAHHGDERLSQSTILQGGEQALAAALSGKDPGTMNAIMGALGIGAKVGLELPFSRKQESEADHIGLIYMARAGYDPHESLAFWQRMEQMANSGGMPAFLSDHPSQGQRIADIQKWLPEAVAQYNSSGQPPAPGLTPAQGQQGGRTAPTGSGSQGAPSTTPTSPPSGSPSRPPTPRTTPER
jgi:metalloendopeptidase OMA1, mitochondrial